MAGDLHAPGDALYRQKLGDGRWQALAARIKERSGWRCVVCDVSALDTFAPGETCPPIEVHHKRYTTLDPWDEDPANLETRCANCHGLEPIEKLDAMELKARLSALALKVASLNKLVVPLLGEAQLLGVYRGAES